MIAGDDCSGGLDLLLNAGMVERFETAVGIS